MLVLDISDDGELVLVHISEEASMAIRAFAYPLVELALSSDSSTDTERLRHAVERERHRVTRKQTDPPLTSRGREIQQAMDLPTSVVRRHEKRAARATLARTPVPDAKKRH
jgi:hypothetical protein